MREKILQIEKELNELAAERKEAIHTMILAVLTKRNFFILGQPGQAKTMIIEELMKRISGARCFITQLAKETNRGQLFGNTDLSSLIPGSVPKSVLMQNSVYRDLTRELEILLQSYEASQEESILKRILETEKKLEVLRRAVSELEGGRPRVQTKGKIAESDLILLDELFKCNNSALTSLLMALNERQWDNEGELTDLPVLSFFGSSNELPNLESPDEKDLEALYDRFELKAVTQYVENRENRLTVLAKKQSGLSAPRTASITIDELKQAQEEIKGVKIPDSINDRMDMILCRLRDKKIPVSDRVYFNYGPIVQAQAWLNGCDEVSGEHLRVLKAYLWKKPEQIPVVERIIAEVCENPFKEELDRVLEKMISAEEAFSQSENKLSAFVQFRSALANAYEDLQRIRSQADSSMEADIDAAESKIEEISKQAHAAINYSYAPMRIIHQYARVVS